MPFVTAGLPGLGHTQHFLASYAWPLDGPDAAIARQGTCADDYDLVTRWFGDVEVEPVEVGISTAEVASDRAPMGPSWRRRGALPSIPVQRRRGAASATCSSTRSRSCSCAPNDRRWMDAKSPGHGLSLARFLGARALAANAMSAPDLDLQPANAWMQTAREDLVNGPGNRPRSYGCRVLFLYYLEMELEYWADQIVRAGGPTVADAYRTLTRTEGDPFPEFKALLVGRFPDRATIPDHPDNPRADRASGRRSSRRRRTSDRRLAPRAGPALTSLEARALAKPSNCRREPATGASSLSS